MSLSKIISIVSFFKRLSLSHSTGQEQLYTQDGRKCFYTSQSNKRNRQRNESPTIWGSCLDLKYPNVLRHKKRKRFLFIREMVHAFSVHFNKNSPGRLPHLRFRVRSLQITEKYNCFLLACLFFINLPSFIYQFQLLIKVIWL